MSVSQFDELKDPALVAEVELARAAAQEEAGDEVVGAHVGAEIEGAAAVTHLFEADKLGYRGWRWAVTLSSAGPGSDVTVSEVVLLPGPDALVAPEWVPWEMRVRAGDLGVGDLMPTAPDDSRLVPAYVHSDDPAVEELAMELGLGRPRVMARPAREDAAARWFESEFGPRSDMARSAPGHCATCGFYLPLAGSLGAAFGTCGNEIAPADGHVVHAEYGCGAHSEAQVEQVSPVLVANLIYDDAQLDVEPITPATPDATEDTPTAAPAAEPAEPAAEPAAATAEVAQPAEATAEPVAPTGEEATPTPEPAAPAAEPAEAATELTTPATEPAETTAEPAEATTELATPSAEPAAATTEPATPSAEPAETTTEPAEATTEPAAPATEPAEAITETAGVEPVEDAPETADHAAEAIVIAVEPVGPAEAADEPEPPAAVEHRDAASTGEVERVEPVPAAEPAGAEADTPVAGDSTGAPLSEAETYARPGADPSEPPPSAEAAAPLEPLVTARTSLPHPEPADQPAPRADDTADTPVGWIPGRRWSTDPARPDHSTGSSSEG